AQGNSAKMVPSLARLGCPPRGGGGPPGNPRAGCCIAWYSDAVNSRWIDSTFVRPKAPASPPPAWGAPRTAVRGRPASATAAAAGAQAAARVRVRLSMGSPPRRRALREDVLDHVALHVGQAHVAAGVAVGQPLVVQAEQVQDRRVPVVDVDLALD